MNRTILVALGGLVGSVGRYWISTWAQSLNGTQFPIGTLTVNILGSFAVGVFMTLSLERDLIGADVRVLLTTGFCGGFTTMSTFSYETLALLREGGGASGIANIAATLAACLTSVWLGVVVGRVA